MSWQPYVKPPAECGTDAGYYRHRRTTHTQPCDPCKAAHAATHRTPHHRAIKARNAADYRARRRVALDAHTHHVGQWAS